MDAVRYPHWRDDSLYSPPSSLLEKPSTPPASILEHLHQNLIRQLLIMIFIVALFGGDCGGLFEDTARVFCPAKAG
jgi:hypothetical protein